MILKNENDVMKIISDVQAGRLSLQKASETINNGITEIAEIAIKQGRFMETNTLVGVYEFDYDYYNQSNTHPEEQARNGMSIIYWN